MTKKKKCRFVPDLPKLKAYMVESIEYKPGVIVIAHSFAEVESNYNGRHRGYDITSIERLHCMKVEVVGLDDWGTPLKEKR